MITFDKQVFKHGLSIINGFTINKTKTTYSIQKLNDIKKVVEWTASKYNDLAVPAFNFTIVENKNDKYVYSYDMMRMGKLSGEQRFIVKFISDLIYESKIDPFNPNSLDKGLRKNVEKAWNNHRDLMMFLMDIEKLGIYHDLHEGNVMIHPDDESFRLIDLEGFIHGESYNLDWIQ